MSDAEFIVNFISESASIGVNAVKAAKDEIFSIDLALTEAEKLKIRRMKLVSVLEHLGDETFRRRRSSATPSSDDIDVSLDDIKEILRKIRTVIDQFGPITVRDLIIKVGGYDMDAIIMGSVKWLGDQEIVSRDSDLKVKPGKNWEKEI